MRGGADELGGRQRAARDAPGGGGEGGGGREQIGIVVGVSGVAEGGAAKGILGRGQRWSRVGRRPLGGMSVQMGGGQGREGPSGHVRMREVSARRDHGRIELSRRRPRRLQLRVGAPLR